eukprot:SAG22_NODE_8506_length_650_cov_1.181488_1_plen_175_part_00
MPSLQPLPSRRHHHQIPAVLRQLGAHLLGGAVQPPRRPNPADPVAPAPVVGEPLRTNLGGNVAVVTGAAGAIGSAVAEQLLRNGATVCICDRGGQNRAMGGEVRDGAAALEQKRGELAAATGGDCHAYVCDVTSQEQIEAMFAAIDAEFGRLDILANVAGIGNPLEGRLPFRQD